MIRHALHKYLYAYQAQVSRIVRMMYQNMLYNTMNINVLYYIREHTKDK